MQVKTGSTVRVASILSAAQTQYLYATVLSVAPQLPELLGADGEPTISIAYLDPQADPTTFGSANWFQAFKRESNVAHASHEAVEKGERGIYWIDEVPDAAEIHPLPDSLPELTTGESAVFSRAKVDTFFDERAAAYIPKKVEPVTEPVTPTIETKTYSDGTTATGVAPLPDLSPAQQDALYNPTTRTTTPAVGTDAAPATPPEPESATEGPSEPAPASESAMDSTAVPTEPLA